ncbi:hypothetical protein PHMEG_0002577 [Phytophthora megakarya]|uniref:Ndc10 domain-containing protein n=1 Tax=Phytophthora megakarya TaxID=4795 RepID=A0A225WYP0_9STRA|nr:hypothetical protein PHMEG_0002577 [Phytophthora megakarya]
MGKRSGVFIRSYAAAVEPRKTVEAIEASEVDTQLEIDESERATIQTTLKTRPINTKRKYDAYQKEYIQWCTAREFRVRGTVTGGKLNLFLSSMVIGRKSTMNSEKSIGGSTACGYTNAIVDLYKQQVALRTNSNQHPRTPAVKQLIKNVQMQTTATKEKNYEDRGIGSLSSKFATHFSLDDIRGHTAFLLSHFGLLRGETVRDLEFADMFSQNLGGEGYQSCIALVILVQHGKPNTFGKLQHVGYMRNKDVHICPVGAAAIEPFPCFRKLQDWYDTKLLRGRQRDKSITYEMHKPSYEAVFKYSGLTFSKKTHINRQQGVLHLESADVDISQTRRHGKWRMDTCEAVYAAPLARKE